VWRVEGVRVGGVSNNTNQIPVLIIFIHWFIDSSIHGREYNAGRDNP
jgi:hypothetical protein